MKDYNALLGIKINQIVIAGWELRLIFILVILIGSSGNNIFGPSEIYDRGGNPWKLFIFTYNDRGRSFSSIFEHLAIPLLVMSLYWV